MKPTIYVLVGMVASGKSTYCRNAAKKGIIILNDDALVNLLHADNYTLYDHKLKILYKSVENNIISLALCLGKDIIIDRGLNISRNGRQRWIALAKSFDVNCEAIVFDRQLPEVHANRRFNSDPRGHTYTYWLNVANDHDKIYWVPNFGEGFNQIHEINFSEVLSGKVIQNEKT
jgi:predicted kinase